MAPLVLEAAEILIELLHSLELECDLDAVRCGALLHDIGKCIHPDELTGPGNLHEAAGEIILQDEGFPPQVVFSRFSLGGAESPFVLVGRRGFCNFLLALAQGEAGAPPAKPRRFWPSTMK